MKVVTRRGQVYEGKTAQEIVRQMKISAMTVEATVQRYMAKVSSRTEMMRGTPIPHTAEEKFLAELYAIGELAKFDKGA